MWNQVEIQLICFGFAFGSTRGGGVACYYNGRMTLAGICAASKEIAPIPGPNALD